MEPQYTLQQKQEFCDRLVTGDLWPVRRLDLTPLDFYLFGHIKNYVFENHFNTLDDLDAAIQQ